MDAVAHHAVLKTYNGDLDLGSLIIHHQSGMGASPHGDLTVRVPPRIFEDGGSVGHNVRGPGCREGRTDNGVER